jgi:hypothetical protein
VREVGRVYPLNPHPIPPPEYPEEGTGVAETVTQSDAFRQNDSGLQTGAGVVYDAAEFASVTSFARFTLSLITTEWEVRQNILKKQVKRGDLSGADIRKYTGLRMSGMVDADWI